MKTIKKKKILFIMPSMVAGGAERVLINLLNLIDKDKYEVDLIVIEKKGKLWNNVPSHVHKSVLFPSPLISKIAVKLYISYRFDFMFKLFGKRIKGDYRTAISFLDSVFSEFLFYNNAEIGKRIAVIHSSYKTYGNKSKFIKGGYKSIMKKRFSRMDTIVTVSQESLSQFRELFGTYPDMHVIYNPINNKEILKNALKPSPEELKSQTCNFIAVGSLLPVKGYDLLLDACHLLKTKIDNFKVFILGEGPLKDKLQKTIEDLGLKNFVVLQGFVSNPYTWMKHADALIMSSIAEGLPTVLCESLILETPPIVPNVPGCREVIDYGKYGLMYDRNPEELAKKMEAIVKDKDLFNSYKLKAKERAKIFDDKKALESYYRIFE